MGSPGFFAPEVLLAAAYDGARADAWSLGAVLVECLLGGDVFGAVWLPAYDDLRDGARFAANVEKAVASVVGGASDDDPTSEPALGVLGAFPPARDPNGIKIPSM